MSHRTAATALLLASLPYGLALPQFIPLVSELAPNVTPRPLPLVAAVNASTVTVVGTLVQPAAESAVEDVTDAVEDATETIASALESVTDAVEDVLSTDAPSILDPEANILPLILPGILPVETDLPPVETPDVVPSDLQPLDPGIGDGTFPGDDLSDTNDLEVIDLPPPNGDDGLIAETLPYIPDFPDFPEEATVPISTFNAVVQPLLTVIQTLLNSLPGNLSPPLPGILAHPLLPTETPEIFIDPLLPTETFDDTAATATDAVDPLIDLLVDSIPTTSIAADLPFTKRQVPTDVDTNSIFDLITPILEAINALIAQISLVGPVVSDVASDVESAVTELPNPPIDVPAASIEAPVLPIANISLPSLPLPPATTPAVLPTDDAPLDVLETVLAEPPLTTPPALPADLTSDIPDEVLNVPFPDDIEGIDWAAFESPPFSDLPPLSLDDAPIPEDILNVPVPDFDENGIPIDGLLDAASAITSAVPPALPTSLDAIGDISEDLLDWPFSDIPGAIVPDVDGELPDFDDLRIPEDVLNADVADVGVPLDLPTDAASGLLADPLANPPLPTDLPEAAVTTELLDVPFPTGLLDVPLPTDLLDIPVPEGFEDLPLPTDAAVPTVDDVADFTIPDDVLNIPWPELDENGIPLDTPLAPVDGIAAAPAALPTNLNWFDIPVPDDWVEDDDVPLDVAAPVASAIAVPDDFSEIPSDVLNIPFPELDDSGVPTDLPAPALSIEDFGDGFPIQALPDVPLVLPAVPDVVSDPPVDDLLPVEGPAALTEALTEVPTDALSGLLTSDLAGVLPVPTDAAAAAVTGLTEALPLSQPDLAAFGPTLPLPTEALAVLSSLAAPAVASAVAAPALPVAVPAVAAPALAAVPSVVPRLPFQVPGARGPLSKRLGDKLKKRQYGGAFGGLLTSIPGFGGTAAPAVPNFGGLAGTVNGAVPNVPFVGGVGGAVPALTGGFGGGALPNLGGLPSTVTGAVNAAPGIGEVASTFTGVAPKVPLAFDSGLTKTLIPANLPLNSSVVLDAIKPLLTTVESLVNSLPSSPASDTAALPIDPQIIFKIISPLLQLANALVDTIPAPVPELPAVSNIISGLQKRGVVTDVPDLPVPLDISVILSIVKPLLELATSLLTKLPGPASIGGTVSTLPVSNIFGGLPFGKRDTAAIPDVDLLSVIKPLLALVNQLLENLTVPVSLQVPGVDVDSIVGGLTKRQSESVSSTLDPASVLSLVEPLIQTILGLLKALPVNPTTVIPKLPLSSLGKRQLGDPSLQPAQIVGLVKPLLTLITSLLQAITSAKVPPTTLSLTRRAIEDFQQGPASDWESFLGELDESKQSELTGLIYNSAKAVNNDDLDALADTLKPDFDNLSDDTKATLLDGFSATSFGKRNTRRAKRQEIPGVQSIGPNLDDAPKIDLSGILSKPLDPFNQLQGVATEGTPVDSVRPPPQGSFEQLADSSVNAGSDPELAAIVAGGGLDPYQQGSGNAVGTSSPVDDAEEMDPYADIRQSLEPAFGAGKPLEGLDATLQAAKNNHFSQKGPNLSFMPSAQGGSAAAQQAEAHAKQEGNVLQWFQRYVKPSWNKEVDAEIVR